MQSHANIQIKADGRRGYLSTTRNIRQPSEHSPFSKDVCIPILQNSGIRSFFYTIVRHGRMPPMDTETIGGISTGLPLYPGLVCVPPYSQNAGDASTYATAWRLLAYHISQLLYSYLCLYVSGHYIRLEFSRGVRQVFLCTDGVDDHTNYKSLSAKNRM